jgi:L-iditol 2-dehydrogenase
MRVAMYYSNSDVRLEDAPMPEIGLGEILMKVHASGICGSDVMEWYRKDRVPLVLGHEVAGEVVKVGDGVDDVKVGDRIVAAHHVPCDDCRYCAAGHHTVCNTLRSTHFYPGGFAEYVRLPEINVRMGVFKIPDGLSHEEASFTEPVACVLRSHRLVNLREGTTVLVLGSGISGILHIHMASRLKDCRVIATDVSEYRLDAARRLGASEAISAADYTPEELREVNNGCLADLVVLCTGAPQAVQQGLESVERGGTVLFFAAAGHDDRIPLRINDIFWRSEVTLTSSYAGSPRDYQDALNLIADGKLNVKDMITHRLPLESAQEGFRLVTEADKSVKVIIEPQK